MKNHLHIEALLDGYLAGTLSDAELREFLSLVNREDSFLKSAIDLWLQEESFTGLAESGRGEVIYRQIMEKKESLAPSSAGEQKVVSLSKYRWKRLLAVASVLALLLFGARFLLDRHETKMKQIAVHPVMQDVAPGGNKAVLTLADGTQIILDSVQGNIVQLGSLNISNRNGRLDYEGQGHTVEYHTLSTPKGGQYKLLLPDGSDVWLNAASSITFPTAFTGKERKVTITGEAYFEVAHNAAHPFHVSVMGMNIQVLGTHFNVNSYNDEPFMKTTLLEGSVAVSSPSSSGKDGVRLKPGQQARVSQLANEPITIITPDLDEVMAWKNGYFEFRNTELKTIMRQIMRWYDVDVEYQDNLPDRYFTADISRNKNLSALLKILEMSNIHFRLEGKKLTVLP